ncbi:MAG: alpha/beta hydrolase [Candidatus Kapabacteria bacterium]|nr:alpha/beta hydrolase [Candidatus Kapabacteria bacterium]
MIYHPERTLAINNRIGEPLHTTITLPPRARTGSPILLILHGFKGFRNYSFLPWIAQYASARGMISIRFCFSRNGMNGTSWSVQDVDAFARNTISHEVDDVHDLIRSIGEDEEHSELRDQWNGQVFVIGHSRGGGVAQIVSREVRDHGNIHLIRTAVLNSVGTFVRWTPRQRAQWAEQGFFTFLNERTKQELRMNMSYVEDIEKSADRLSLDRASAMLGDTLAYIHAEQDLTVPLAEIVRLRESAETDAPLFVVPNTTHTFGMSHPVDRISLGFVEALNKTFTWLIQ